MSLLRLLTAGKCLIGLQKPKSRYHLPGVQSLPRFGSKKNPFRATVKPCPNSLDGQPSQQPVSNDAGSEETEREGSAAESGNKENCKGSGFKALACSVDAQQSFPAGRRPPAFKALLLWGRARKEALSNAPVRRPMVQGELSLDSVKVLRNDLSESDLEVIQGTGAPAINAKEKIDAVEESKSAGQLTPWGASAGRLFGVDKM